MLLLGKLEIIDKLEINDKLEIYDQLEMDDKLEILGKLEIFPICLSFPIYQNWKFPIYQTFPICICSQNHKNIIYLSFEVEKRLSVHRSFSSVFSTKIKKRFRQSDKGSFR